MREDVERMREALALIEERARAALDNWLAGGPSGVHDALEAIVDLAEAALPAHEERRAGGSRASFASPPGTPQHMSRVPRVSLRAG
jgi:hypothetical protein